MLGRRRASPSSSAASSRSSWYSLRKPSNTVTEPVACSRIRPSRAGDSAATLSGQGGGRLAGGWAVPEQFVGGRHVLVGMGRDIAGQGLRRLYDLIWKRTAASQMASALHDQVSIDIADPS